VKTNAGRPCSSPLISREVQRICDRVAIIKEGRIVDLKRIEDLRKNSYKKVSLTTASPLTDFSLPGAAKIAQDGNQTSFLYSGDVNALFARLAGMQLVNADVSEPELEEIFLHYYEDGEAKA
jgi:ABC-2 type transport system ATP-binding protein